MEQGESTSFIANPKYYTSSKYTAVTLRKGPIGVIQGGWVGESYGEFYGLSGVYRTSGKSFFDGSIGLVHMTHYYGNQLDGDTQFTYTIGIGRRFDDLSVMVKVRHFSNGNSQGFNWGQDFIILNFIYNTYQ